MCVCDGGVISVCVYVYVCVCARARACVCVCVRVCACVLGGGPLGQNLTFEGCPGRSGTSPGV